MHQKFKFKGNTSGFYPQTEKLEPSWRACQTLPQLIKYFSFGMVCLWNFSKSILYSTTKEKTILWGITNSTTGKWKEEILFFWIITLCGFILKLNCNICNIWRVTCYLVKQNLKYRELQNGIKWTANVIVFPFHIFTPNFWNLPFFHFIEVTQLRSKSNTWLTCKIK